jgi:transcriptional regulator with XRE-family HTH domain
MHYNVFIMAKTPFISLNPILTQELFTLGQLLRALRKKKKMTLSDMQERIGVDPRTIGKIEKGDPTVSLGTFIQYLNILGLAQGVSERILGDYLKMVSEVESRNIFSDKEMDF